MKQAIAALSLLVSDYNEARDWYCRALGFKVIEDTEHGPGKRWLVVAPNGAHGANLLLAKAVGDEQIAAIGRQAGGRVFLFLHTDDFARDHAAMCTQGVKFLEDPRAMPYGSVAVFEDLYGNKWDLLQTTAA